MGRLAGTLGRMNSPSPDQIRRMNEEAAQFELDWYFDTNTKEIRHRELRFIEKLTDIIWRRRHRVRAMYWWVKYNWATEKLIVFHFPLRHDNMPIPGFPMKSELQGGWTIPESDLKCLRDGPLASENLTRLLVPADLGWRQLFKTAKQFAPVITIVAGTVTVLTNSERLLEFLRRLANAA